MTSAMRATLRLSSATSPQLWSSESFAKRVQTLRENALDFPRSLYPLVPRGVKVTPIREFVKSFGDCTPEQIKTDTRFTLNGTSRCSCARLTHIGRVKAVRRLGKNLMFVKAQQDDSTVQILCRFNALPAKDVKTWDGFRKTIHQGAIYCRTP
jgi:lysyl-tRNA synthetase class II